MKLKGNNQKELCLQEVLIASQFSQNQQSSKRSRQSSIGSVAIRARAKAEAAYAQLPFAEQEADIINKKVI